MLTSIHIAEIMDDDDDEAGAQDATDSPSTGADDAAPSTPAPSIIQEKLIEAQESTPSS